MADIKIPDSAYFYAGAAPDLKIRHDGTNSAIRNDTGTLTINNYANANMILATNNTTAVTINNAQNVGIGDTDPSEAKLSISSVLSGDTGLLVDQDQNRYGIEVDHEGSSYAAVKIASTVTSGAVIDCTSIDALTTGSIANFNTASTALATTAASGLVSITSTGDTDTNVNNLLFIKNDHADSSETTGLYVLQDSTTWAAQIKSTHATNGRGLYISAGDDNNVPAFRVADKDDNDKFTIQGSGNVGIGTTSPTNTLDVRGKMYMESSDPGIELLDTSTGPYNPIILKALRAGGDRAVQNGEDLGIIYAQGYDSGAYRDFAQIRFAADAVVSSGDAPGRIEFWTTPDSSTTIAERLRIDSSGDVTVSTGNLVIGTSGKGIDFTAEAASTESGTDRSSSVLDDYEEGTWTAVVSDGTNAMTLNGTYDTGYYTKIGNVVTISGYFVTTSAGSASGDLRIYGLPFACSGNPAAYTGTAFAYGAALNITAGHTIGGYVELGQTYISLQVWDAATGVTAMQASEWSADGQCMINITYRV